MVENCECGYFDNDCECCGDGRICPVCNLPKYVNKGESE